MSESKDATPLGKNYFRLFAASTISNLGDGIGVVAYPWLASAITRNPLLIALVAVMQRIPWLVFSLPAGVLADRHNRRTLMVWSNVVRTVVTLVVAAAVLARGDMLPGPDEIEAAVAIDTDIGLYLLILVATLCLGVAEVLYDNSGQTLMPALVAEEHLEKANGRLWSVEMVANSLAGPPLGALLLAAAFVVPFAVDAATFAVSAALIALIPKADAERTAKADRSDKSMKEGIKEGFSWLWNHEFLRPLAIILGLLNGLGVLSGAVLILFAQEVLETSPTEYALLNTGGAFGGIIGGWTASKLTDRVGPGPSLYLTLLVSAATSLVIGLTSNWIVVWAMFMAFMYFAVVWNVITVSLRQQIIPDDLLGRVNSVYRFFAWGMMPIGLLAGGVLVAVAEEFVSRESALRAAWLATVPLYLLLFLYAAPKLSTKRIEAARAEGKPSAPVESNT